MLEDLCHLFFCACKCKIYSILNLTLSFISSYCDYKFVALKSDSYSILLKSKVKHVGIFSKVNGGLNFSVAIHWLLNLFKPLVTDKEKILINVY